MSKSVRISEELHEYIKGHKSENETMEETIRRLIGGPHPEEVAGILSSETADTIRDRLDTKNALDADAKRTLRDRFE
ncbi:antitoxin VapB family protein [Halovivax gelatinilyticus]|uniref:antitoxin VapB family protein n=1 Tax=Halovivax gelatinilyticus TaxID=2961597 RepID=UPI0020CA68FF|nr:antitoxin VapB family protein [Halovivax gelatinilyticus]